MTNKDINCVCRDCERTFIFTAKQQQDFRKRGYNSPSRCPECHARRNSRRNYSRGGDCEMHTAACSVCGNETKLPFKPTGDKPVYCTECMKNHLQAKSKQPTKSFALRKKETPVEEHKPETGSFGDFQLDPKIERAIREAGYDSPTPVQAKTIPIGLKGGDLVGTAQTGTGKTAAFVLPILQHLVANPVPKPRTRAIVLTPTRELAEQINDTFKTLGKFTKIKSATVYGGVGMVPQEEALKKGVEVIVACPGRLLDHMDRGNANLKHVEKLVLDEADRMLDMGFLPPIKRILSGLPKSRQSMLFSATFAPELDKLTAEHLDNPKRVDVDLYAPAKTIAHALYPCPQHLKTALVMKLLEMTDTNSVLIFTRTKHRANRLAQQLSKAGYGTAALHSNRSQNQRQSALDDFREGRCQILVATDIAARGLDVESISHVINFDIPETADMYIHRIGRTGRAEREGDAMTLITNQDAGIVFDIEKALGNRIERRRLDDFDYDVPAPVREAAPARSYSRKPRIEAPAAKPAPRSNGYFATQRKYRGRKAD